MKAIIAEIKNIKSDKKELRKFCISIGIVLLLFGSIALWRGKTFFPLLYICSGIAFGSAAFFPLLLLPLQKVMASILIILQYAFTFIVLVIMFYLVFTPISICGKLFKKRCLGDPINKQATSYWVQKEQQEGAPEIYERQF